MVGFNVDREENRIKVFPRFPMQNLFYTLQHIENKEIIGA